MTQRDEYIIKTGTAFIKLADEMSKEINPFIQIKKVQDFLSNIYDAGYNAGYTDGTRIKIPKNPEQN